VCVCVSVSVSVQSGSEIGLLHLKRVHTHVVYVVSRRSNVCQEGSDLLRCLPNSGLISFLITHSAQASFMCVCAYYS
jgi:hypothetical protein